MLRCARRREHQTPLRLRSRASSPCGPGRRFPGTPGGESRGAPSLGPRQGAAFRQRGGRWRCFRDCAWRLKSRRTRRGPEAQPQVRALPGPRGAAAVRGSRAPEGGALPGAPLSAPSGRGIPTARSLGPGHLAGFGRSVVSRPPPPGRAAAPKCAIGRARRRCLLPPPRSHGDPRQPMQWTLGPCGTPGAATAPAPPHYKYFSKMRRSSQRAPRPHAASAPRP